MFLKKTIDFLTFDIHLENVFQTDYSLATLGAITRAVKKHICNNFNIWN